MDNPIHNGDMDDCFGDMLYNYKAEPDSAVWDNIQQQLDPLNNLDTKFQDYKVEPDGMLWNQIKKDLKPENKKQFPYKRLVAIAALLLLPVFIAFVSWEPRPDSSLITLAKNDDNQINTSMDFSEKTAEELKVNTSITTVGDKNININQAKTIKQNTENYVVEKQEKEEFLRSEKAFSDLQANHLLKNGKEVNKLLVKNEIAKETKKRNQFTKGVFYDRTLNGTYLVDSPSDKTTDWELRIEALSVINAPFDYSISNEIKRPSLKEPTFIERNPLLSKREKSISSFVGINLNQWHILDNEEEEYKEWAGEITDFSTWSIGALLDLPINQHWSIKTGLMNHRFYSRIMVEAAFRPKEIEVGELYKQFEVDLVMHNHFYQVMANGRKIGSSFPLGENILMTAEQSLQYLTIPLYLEYTVNPTQRLKVALTSGINGNILLQNKIELLDFEVEGALINGFALSDSNGLSNINWSYSGGVNLTYPLSAGWSSYVQTLYTRSITKFKGDLHKSNFTSIGLQTGLKFSF